MQQQAAAHGKSTAPSVFFPCTQPFLCSHSEHFECLKIKKFSSFQKSAGDVTGALFNKQYIVMVCRGFNEWYIGQDSKKEEKLVLAVSMYDMSDKSYYNREKSLFVCLCLFTSCSHILLALCLFGKP